MVRQPHQPVHPTGLRECREGFHALRRNSTAGGFPRGDPRPRHRLARRPPAAGLEWQYAPAPSGGAVLLVRLSLRPERRDSQPGERREAPPDRRRGRPDPGAGRSPGAEATPCARRAIPEDHAGPGDPRHAALPRATARGAVQAAGEGLQARAARRAAPQGVRQGRQDPLRAAASCR